MGCPCQMPATLEAEQRNRPNGRGLARGLVSLRLPQVAAIAMDPPDFKVPAADGLS